MGELELADIEQCQAERQVGAFQLGGQIGKRIRCTNTPRYIARENKPGDDGLIGEMSLCDQCAEKMTIQLGKGFATLRLIGSALSREPSE